MYLLLKTFVPNIVKYPDSKLLFEKVVLKCVAKYKENIFSKITQLKCYHQMSNKYSFQLLLLSLLTKFCGSHIWRNICLTVLETIAAIASLLPLNQSTSLVFAKKFCCLIWISQFFRPSDLDAQKQQMSTTSPLNDKDNKFMSNSQRVLISLNPIKPLGKVFHRFQKYHILISTGT